MADWEGIRTAYLDLQRRRLGLPSRLELEDRRIKQEREAALQASQLETAGLGREKMRTEIEALPETQRLQRESLEALTAARNAQAARQPTEPSSMLERIMAMPPDQQAAAIRLHRQMNPPPATNAISPFVANVGGVPSVVDRRTGQAIPGMAPVETAEQRNRQAGLGRAGQVLGAIEELSATINTAESGIGARLGGLQRRGAATAGYDPEMREYRSLVRGFTPLFARAVGHTGVLTEQDVQRTEELFPLPEDSAEEAGRKLARVRSILSGQASLPFQYGAAGAAPTSQGATTTVRTQADYDALPSGTIFFTPDGRRKRKP